MNETARTAQVRGRVRGRCGRQWAAFAALVMTAAACGAGPSTQTDNANEVPVGAGHGGHGSTTAASQSTASSPPGAPTTFEITTDKGKIVAGLPSSGSGQGQPGTTAPVTAGSETMPATEMAASGHDHGTTGATTSGTVSGAPAVVAPAPSGKATRVITNADKAALAGGFTVPAGEIWEFDPSQSVTIEVSKNVRVEGVLRMKPANAGVQHLLQFVNVNEKAFVGGGMSVLDTDVGVWVTGNGQLDLQGSPRTGWTRLADSADAGAIQLVLAQAPVGWQVGDQLSLAPTASPTTRGFSTQFDERTITAVNGSTITLDAPLKYGHPKVNAQWTAEVMNLTRNVRIEGQGNNTPAASTTGRAHVLIISAKPQTVRYVQLRNLGVRKGTAGNSSGVLGRYSLHFHHCGDGSRGSIVEGVVVRNSGNSAFVPHASNGIVMRDNIAYDGWENAFWWDQPTSSKDNSNDTADLLWEHNIVALLRSDPDFRGYQLSGFTLATGTNLTTRDSVAVGVQGTVNANGFIWPEHTNVRPSNLWTFTNNVAHNNRTDGIFVWANDSMKHVIADYSGYYNGEAGIDHGAYQNGFQYQNLKLYGNGKSALTQHSASIGGSGRTDGYGLSFESVATDGALRLMPQTLRGPKAALYRQCSFSSVVIENNGSANNPGLYDFVDCNLSPENFVFKSAEGGTLIRVQNGASAFQLDDKGAVTTIPTFYG